MLHDALAIHVHMSQGNLSFLRRPPRKKQFSGSLKKTFPPLAKKRVVFGSKTNACFDEKQKIQYISLTEENGRGVSENEIDNTTKNYKEFPCAGASVYVAFR